MRSVVISGVSTGIGFGLAQELGRQGIRVFGTIRDAALEASLRGPLGPDFVPLVLDVTDRAAIDRAAATVARETEGSGLFGLVNNAGICDPGPLANIAPEALRRHLEVNVIGVLNMVQAFLPLLRKSDAGRPGRIVNISSVSGKIAYPFMGAYAASKFGLEAMSDSLRRELMVYGVDVILIEPGSIDTPIWDKANHISKSFADTDYAPLFEYVDLVADNRRNAQPVSRVADRVLKGLTAAKPKTRYALPDKWLLYWMLPRLLPDRLLDRIIYKALDMKRVKV
ncbi:MAG TPA: SDR family NAD(P)-dependent oxidoreductase [Reyranella sp.]|nr:SDR family NAD(P)-dependent oxidoreductase [Reyranella sp.]